MKIELNRESAEALYQIAQYLPRVLAVMAEQTNRVCNVYQSVSDSIGPHADQFLEMMVGVRGILADSGDDVNALAAKFSEVADRIMEFVDAKPDQPQLILRKR